MGAGSSGISDALRKRPFLFLFGALIAASAVLMLHYRSQLNFMLDDWAFVIYRAEGTPADFLNPHNEHIVVLPVAIYKVFLEVFGMTSVMPLQIFSVGVFLVSVVVLFAYMRPLVGEAAAVIGCGVVLFLGTAWEDLLWTFQIGFSISITCGIGALIMLRREDRKGDRIACLLLTVAMISSSMGIPFAVGAFVQLASRRRELFSRIYIVAVPLAVYAAWWLGWGHTAESAISLDNAIGAPEYVFNSFRLALSELTGAFRLADGPEKLLTTLLVLVVVVLGAWAMRSRNRLPLAFLVAAAVALAFWGLAALNLSPGRGYQVSRYQYPAVVFTLMILAGAFEGVRPRPRHLAVLAAVAAFAIFANVVAMRDGFNTFFKPLSDKGIAGLTAVDLASGSVDPSLTIGMNADGAARVDVGSYFEAEDRYGSVAWSEAELEGSSLDAQARVDEILIDALPVTGQPAKGMGAACESVRASPDGGLVLPQPGPTFTYRPDGLVFLTMGRYADVPKGVARTLPGEKTLISVPPDESDEPWRIGFLGDPRVRVRVCSGGTGFPPGTEP